MKTLLNVLILPVVIVGFCGITDAENIVTDGLLSYWTFDREDIIGNTVKDVWGENNAIIVGTPSLVNGHLKEALKFDGIKDYVNLTTLGDFGAKLDFSTVFIDGRLNRISKVRPIVPNTRYKYVPFFEPVYLGAGNNRGSAEGFFNGIIDEVRIYDRPLTAAEIMRNYQSTTGLAVHRTDKLSTVWGALKKR